MIKSFFIFFALAVLPSCGYISSAGGFVLEKAGDAAAGVVESDCKLPPLARGVLRAKAASATESSDGGGFVAVFCKQDEGYADARDKFVSPFESFDLVPFVIEEIGRRGGSACRVVGNQRFCAKVEVEKVDE